MNKVHNAIHCDASKSDYIIVKLKKRCNKYQYANEPKQQTKILVHIIKRPMNTYRNLYFPLDQTSKIAYNVKIKYFVQKRNCNNIFKRRK